MGLTVHYSIKCSAKSSGDARAIVERMRQLALDLPFESVGEIIHLAGGDCEAGATDEQETGIRFLVQQATVPVRVPWAVKRFKREFGTEQVCTRYAEAAPLDLFAFVAMPGPGCEPVRLGLASYPQEVEAVYNPAEDVRFLDNELAFSQSKWRRFLARQGRSPDEDPDGNIETRRLPTRRSGWRWASFCKTQYASDPKHGGPANFLRCHVGVVALLDRVAQLDGVKVEVYDEGKYGRHPSPDDGSGGKSATMKARAGWSPGNYDPRALLDELGHWNGLMAASLGALKDAFGGDVAGPILTYRDFERLEFKGRGRFDVDSFLAEMKNLATPERDSQW